MNRLGCNRVERQILRVVAEDAFGKVVIVLAHVLEEFQPVGPSHIEAAGPCRCIGAGVVDRHFIFQRSEIRPRDAFNMVQTIGVW